MSDLTRRYAKACDLADFRDPRLRGVLRDILPERDPVLHVERKVWEFAQLAMFLSDLGLLDDRSQVLGVGAGDERILFWLANRVGEVVATDIYGSGDFASREAGGSMLTDPSAHAPFSYREDRLEVRWMDARGLRSLTRASTPSTRCPRSSTSVGPGRWTWRRERSRGCSGRGAWRFCASASCCAATR